MNAIEALQDKVNKSLKAAEKILDEMKGDRLPGQEYYKMKIIVYLVDAICNVLFAIAVAIIEK